MQLATVQPGDKLSVFRFNRFVIYTVESVSARYVKAKAEYGTHCSEFVKSSGRERGDESRFPARASVASESEIAEGKRDIAYVRFTTELDRLKTEAQRLKLTAKQLDDLRYQIQYLFDGKREN